MLGALCQLIPISLVFHSYGVSFIQTAMSLELLRFGTDSQEPASPITTNFSVYHVRFFRNFNHYATYAHSLHTDTIALISSPAS